jgi:hypothetical protein
MTTVSVTHADIADGQLGDCELCPVALAVRRLLRPGVVVSVMANLLIMDEEVEGRRPRDAYISLPNEAFDLIMDFDAGRRVAPLSFALDIPARYLREAAP